MDHPPASSNPRLAHLMERQHRHYGAAVTPPKSSPSPSYAQQKPIGGDFVQMMGDSEVLVIGADDNNMTPNKSNASMNNNNDNLAENASEVLWSATDPTGHPGAPHVARPHTSNPKYDVFVRDDDTVPEANPTSPCSDYFQRHHGKEAPSSEVLWSETSMQFHSGDNVDVVRPKSSNPKYDETMTPSSTPTAGARDDVAEELRHHGYHYEHGEAQLPSPSSQGIHVLWARESSNLDPSLVDRPKTAKRNLCQNHGTGNSIDDTNGVLWARSSAHVAVVARPHTSNPRQSNLFSASNTGGDSPETVPSGEVVWTHDDNAYDLRQEVETQKLKIAKLEATISLLVDILQDKLGVQCSLPTTPKPRSRRTSGELSKDSVGPVPAAAAPSSSRGGPVRPLGDVVSRSDIVATPPTRTADKPSNHDDDTDHVVLDFISPIANPQHSVANTTATMAAPIPERPKTSRGGFTPKATTSPQPPRSHGDGNTTTKALLQGLQEAQQSDFVANPSSRPTSANPSRPRTHSNAYPNSASLIDETELYDYSYSLHGRHKDDFGAEAVFHKLMRQEGKAPTTGGVIFKSTYRDYALRRALDRTGVPLSEKGLDRLMEKYNNAGRDMLTFDEFAVVYLKHVEM